MKVCWYKAKKGRKPRVGECRLCETCKYFREDEPGDDEGGDDEPGGHGAYR